MRDNLHMMIIAQKSLIIMAGVTSRMMRNGWEKSEIHVKYCFYCIFLISQLFWEIFGLLWSSQKGP
jgi:hypothetical protein